MSVRATVAAGRRAAEALMVDRCTIRHPGAASTDSLTGIVSEAASVVYVGPCKIAQAGAMGQRVDVGEVSQVLLRLQIHLPVAGSEAVRRGDVVTIDAAASDAALAGRTFRIRDLAERSMATARRLGVEEVT